MTKTNFMNKIIFVTGAPGTGKSTFIEKNYREKKTYYVFDLAKISLKLFGDFGALEDDRIIDIYNKACGSGMEALMDNKVLVVEYCLGTDYDDDFISLIKEAKFMGIRTEIIQLTVDANGAWARTERARQDKSYYPSYKLREDNLEILSEILDSFSLSQTLDVICEIGGEGGSIKFYRIENNGKERFFFLTNESALFEFEPELECDKISDIDYLNEYDGIEEAMAGLMEKYPIFELYPLSMHKEYAEVFKKAYLKHLKTHERGHNTEYWEKFLN